MSSLPRAAGCVAGVTCKRNMIASEPRDTATGCPAVDRMLSAGEFRFFADVGRWLHA